MHCSKVHNCSNHLCHNEVLLQFAYLLHDIKFLWLIVTYLLSCLWLSVELIKTIYRLPISFYYYYQYLFYFCGQKIMK